MFESPIVIQNQHATLTIYRHGAHITAFQPHGQRPVLFMSTKSHYELGKPIRGGVPVIFPWFGPHPTDSTAPAHGTVRLAEWELASHTDNEVVLGITTASCRLTYRVKVGASLELTLEVRNAGSAPVQFEEALHTYFAVSDCRHCTVTGLENAVYDSKVEGVTGQSQGLAPIRFATETDRLYLNTRSTCVLHDPGWQRQIVVEKSGSDCTVVWNPWIAKAKAMPDFGDEEWPAMVCIETANARAHAVRIGPGESHTLRQIVRVESFQG